MMRRGFVLPYLTGTPLGGRILIGVLVLLAVLVLCKVVCLCRSGFLRLLLSAGAAR